MKPNDIIFIENIREQNCTQWMLRRGIIQLKKKVLKKSKILKWKESRLVKFLSTPCTRWIWKRFCGGSWSFQTWKMTHTSKQGISGNWTQKYVIRWCLKISGIYSKKGRQKWCVLRSTKQTIVWNENQRKRETFFARFIRISTDWMATEVKTLRTGLYPVHAVLLKFLTRRRRSLLWNE